MHEIRTEIEIDASPGEVWSHLVDFGKYGEWNPYMTSIKGEPVAGSLVDVEVTMPDGSESSFTSELAVVDPAVRLSWLGGNLEKDGIQADHIFEMFDTVQEGCRFVHRETFDGPKAAETVERNGENLSGAFEIMNAALKERAEA